MTYDDYRIHLLTCEYLGKEPTGDYRKVYDFLVGLWDGMEFVVDSRYGWIVLQKGGDIFVEQAVIKTLMWSHEWMETFFRDDMGMEDAGTQEFIKSIMEDYLRCVVVTTRSWAYSI